MSRNVKRAVQDKKYILGKHNCPICMTQVKVVDKSKVLDSAVDEEKKILDGAFGIGNARGLIKCIWKEFECPICGRGYTVKQMKQLDASPIEYHADMVSLYERLSKQPGGDCLGLSEDTTTRCEKKRKKALLLCIMLPIIMALLISVAVIASVVTMILNTTKYEDTNGEDNFELCHITIEDIVGDEIMGDEIGYNVWGGMSTHSGSRTYIGDETLKDFDYDETERSFERLDGVVVLQATRIYKNSLTLEIDSEIKSGNAEIVIIIDGKYHSSVDINKCSFVKLNNIYSKEVVIKLAGESAKGEVEVERRYKE